MAQFPVADIPGAVNRGLQFRQAQELRPFDIAVARQNVKKGEQAFQQGAQNLETGRLKQQVFQQQIDQRTDAQKNQSLFGAALRIVNASDEEIIPLLEEHIEVVGGLGGKSPESNRALELARAGDFDGVRKAAKSIVNVGVRQGEIKPIAEPSLKKETLAIKKGLIPAHFVKLKLGRLPCTVAPSVSRSLVQTVY